MRVSLEICNHSLAQCDSSQTFPCVNINICIYIFFTKIGLYNAYYPAECELFDLNDMKIMMCCFRLFNQNDSRTEVDQG